MSLIFLTNKTGLGSASVQGEQVAVAMGAKCDIPLSEIHADDVVIMVKCIISGIFTRTKKVYCNVADSNKKLESELSLLSNKVTVITQSPRAIKFLEDKIPGHKVIWIPLQHCNLENAKRPNRPIKTILFNGRKAAFSREDWIYFKKKITREGFDTIRKTQINTRIPSCEVYLKADISVSFRKNFHINQAIKKNSLKIHNAGSFHIPTVAYPEIGFVESYGDPNCFVPVKTVDEMIEQCVHLRDDPIFYNKVADLAEKDAAKYHISEIVKWYRKLDSDFG